MNLLLLFFSSLLFAPSDQVNTQRIEDRGMIIEWYFLEDSIDFKISTPTGGWQAIGFNDQDRLNGTYLIMSHVNQQGEVDVTEHFTEKPGHYYPLEHYAIAPRIKIIEGNQSSSKTTIRYRVPLKASTIYHKSLVKGSRLTLHYAYSLEDDYRHHSTYRSKTQIIL